MIMEARIRPLLNRLSRLPRLWTICLAWGLAILIGLLDYATGDAIHVTALYLLPICWASWAAGRQVGLYQALGCTAFFLVAGLLTRHPAVHMGVLFWNALMLLTIFAVAVYSATAALDAYRSLAQAQALLRDANEHLEEAVQRRTAALRSEIAERRRAEQAKIQAERLLERSEKLATLGTLTAGIAHEIRNPLTSLKARLYTLEKHVQATPAAKRDIDIISAEILRLEHIVQDALSFARPAEPKLEPLAAGQMLHEVEGLMLADLDRRGVRLIVEPGPELLIRGDSGHLKQVVINLVRNAAEAIVSPGTVTLRVRAARAMLGGCETDAVILEVSDTGEGIPPDVERRLFDPFFSTKETGTGLGLPIAARIIEKHGGMLQYETRPGLGTTFGVVLPRERGETARSASGSENSSH
jgi:signal transduction histidine kinase